MLLSKGTYKWGTLQAIYHKWHKGFFFFPENGGDPSSRALNLSEKKTIKSEPEDSR